MSEFFGVAIVGAGPYGLSLAAHLRAAGENFQIFGRPMEAWRNHMPEGMLLKSDGFASNLIDPAGEYPLARYCQELGIDYDDERAPVRLETFTAYGLAFASRFAPNLDERQVVSIAPTARGFSLRLEDGETVEAAQVVVAVGIGKFRYVPPLFAEISRPFVSHSYDHHGLASFKGLRVGVIGSGASAIDLVALLQERGADARLICRADKLKFGAPPGGGERSLWRRIRHPRSGLGPGLRSRFCTDAPLLFHAFPASLRSEIVRRHLGPAASGRMRALFEKCPPPLTGHRVVAARQNNGAVELALRAPDGRDVVESFDRVIAATGYRVDLRRLGFLDATLQDRLAHVDQAPVLSAGFESSVKGLFFIGPAAANSFGPLMRFVYGAGFASRRALATLAKNNRTQSGSSRAKQIAEVRAREQRLS